MMYARVSTLKEYEAYREASAEEYARINKLEADLEQLGQEFTVKGYSFPAQCEVYFHIDHLYSVKGRINWRERVICPVTHLNNRLRAVIHFMEQELHTADDSRIYVSEQLTPLYSYLKQHYPHIIGSEYLGPEIKPGYVNDEGIRHEDATNLSFGDGELDYYLSFDCFEHIPDFVNGFAECYRVLKPGGMMMWTVPFNEAGTDNIIRATVQADGTVTHILEPEYHGDPVNPEGGVLCYTNFGWQMFEQLKTLGFTDAYAITYWSDEMGYYGDKQFLDQAEKLGDLVVKHKY